MRLLIIIAALILLALPARAGTITITYTNTAGTVTETEHCVRAEWVIGPQCGIMSILVTSYFPGNPTGQAALNAWANSVFAQLVAQVAEWQGRTAAQAVTPIVVTPAQ